MLTSIFSNALFPLYLFIIDIWFVKWNSKLKIFISALEIILGVHHPCRWPVVSWGGTGARAFGNLISAICPVILYVWSSRPVGEFWEGWGDPFFINVLRNVSRVQFMIESYWQRLAASKFLLFNYGMNATYLASIFPSKRAVNFSNYSIIFHLPFSQRFRRKQGTTTARMSSSMWRLKMMICSIITTLRWSAKCQMTRMKVQSYIKVLILNIE